MDLASELKLTMNCKMWVNIDDWHENPDIIHTKFA